MLSGLFRSAVAELVDEALSTALHAGVGAPAGGAADAPGAALLRVAVVGDVALGRALLAIRKRAAAAMAARGVQPAKDGAAAPARRDGHLSLELAIVAEPGARAARKLEGVIAGSPAQLPVEDGALAAVVGVGALAPENTVAVHRLLGELVRAVRGGGAVVLVDRAPRALATRRALCAGLTEIEQRSTGRAVVTSGLVSHLLAPIR